VGGTFENTCFFGAQSLTSAGLKDAFLARYDKDDRVMWGAGGGGPANEYVGGLGYGPTGNLFLGVRFVGAIRFGSLSAASVGSSDVLLCQYDDPQR
jgi:hypothetical protein